MKRCAEVEPLVTPYLDGVADAQRRADIETHLSACTDCRGQVDAQRAARTVVRARAEALCEKASPALRTRCTAARAVQRWGAAGQRSASMVRTWLPLSVAAVVLAVVLLLLSNLTNRLETSLAAQLTLEHMKCFVLAEPKLADSAHQVEQALATKYGWNIRVPASLPAEGLQLLGARRCLYSEGQMAHLMYKREGRPVSLFVLFNAAHSKHVFEILGHDAIVWAHEGRTYALVGREPAADMQRVAAYVRTASYP